MVVGSPKIFFNIETWKIEDASMQTHLENQAYTTLPTLLNI